MFLLALMSSSSLKYLSIMDRSDAIVTLLVVMVIPFQVSQI